MRGHGSLVLRQSESYTHIVVKLKSKLLSCKLIKTKGLEHNTEGRGEKEEGVECLDV